MRVVVVGGTWGVGLGVAQRIRAAGHEAVSASPNNGANPLTGEGLERVLAGASVVVDLTNNPSVEDNDVAELVRASTDNLLRAERAAGVGHHVGWSVLGIERSPQVPYFQAKLVQDALIKGSGIPYSFVYSTQMFEFLQSAENTFDVGSELRVPPIDFQPVAAQEVVGQLAATALGEPLNGGVQIAGPERYRMDEFFREVLAGRGDPRPVVVDPNSRCYGGVTAKDALVPTDAAVLGTIRFADWAKK
ncbi:SDR family oxidoreductase [Kribbella sandramycini]|uniref:SDR family oxidoreductase n=1 Tax=Kribbella sandramycini TaxID=60450 RepID=A0A7Y4L1S3_9ACTN|nr:uncharacterized protein YbjT (DUF2867 family) [Kribbella sandramycini]NOL42727.1 SDR family oxidoreductase [Kribbella sandramycini]